MEKRADNHASKQQRVLRRYALLLTLVWVVVVSASFMSHFRKHKRCAEKTGYDIALANLNKDQAIRKWSVVHGGVYVPIDARTPPNPHPTPTSPISSIEISSPKVIKSLH